jgi:hypothetical protein
MGRLTGGHIRYNERRRIGDYEHRDCEIVLQFAFDEGGFEPIYFDNLQREIRFRVEAMVLGKDMPKSESSWDNAVNALGAAPEPPKVDAPKRGRKPKAVPVDEAPDPEYDGPANTEAETIDDILDEEDTPRKKKSAITDDTIVDAVKARNAQIKAPEKIKALIRQYAPTSKEIPDEQREKFLRELKALA